MTTDLEPRPAPRPAPRPRPVRITGRGRLVFGQMFEDHAVDAAVLPVGRVLCIASAGDTAFALAGAGSEVTALDSNPAQLRYVRQRLDGGPVLPGSADRLLRVGRAVLRRTGWRPADLRVFCDLEDPTIQIDVWRACFDTPGFRMVLGALLSPASVRSAGFGAFTSGLHDRFDLLMRERLFDGICTHSNRDNPFLRRLLTGEPVRTPVPDRRAVRLVHDDLLAHLESVPESSYDGFSLSNVPDGADAAYAARLRAAVLRAARPGAVAVTRSFAPTADPDRARAARRDRSMLWGSLQVDRLP